MWKDRGPWTSDFLLSDLTFGFMQSPRGWHGKRQKHSRIKASAPTGAGLVWPNHGGVLSPVTPKADYDVDRSLPRSKNFISGRSEGVLILQVDSSRFHDESRRSYLTK